MTVQIHSITSIGYIEPTDPDLTPLAASEDGSAIDLGGGLFLTAAHLFSAVEPLSSPPYPMNSGNGLYDSSSQTLDGVSVAFPPLLDPGYNAGNFYDQIQAGQNYSYPGHDLAFVTAPASASGSSDTLSPLIAFADQDAVTSFLTRKIHFEVAGVA